MKKFFHTTPSQHKLHFTVYENTLPTTTFFIHGNVASNRWWIPTQEAFAEKYSQKSLKGAMVCMEFLGCGESSAPNSPKDVDMIKFATDFNLLIEDYLKSSNKNENVPIEKVNIVGHSTGGFIAAVMTALKPELFNKAVLLDPVGAKGLVLDDNIKAGFEMMKSDRNFTAMAIGATIQNNDATSDFFNQVIVEDAFNAVKKISYWVVQAFHGLDATELLAKSNTATLVLHGEHDKLLSREASEELALKYLKNAQFELVPNHGHCMNIEDPKNFVNKISSFFYV